MHFKTAAVALATSVATVAAQSTCHSYVILSIRGTYEVQGPSIAFPGMINQTLTAIPGGVEYDVVYPAAANQTAYLGADDATRYINEGLQNCPDQKYIILGYSQGASATMLTLANITDPSTAAYKAIKAVLVVGNPYHIPNATANVDENGGDLTKKYPGALYNANNEGSTGIPSIYYENGELLDICHTEDIVCAPGYPNATFAPGHLKYGDQIVQDLGAKFLIAHLGGNSSTPTSSSSSSSSSISTFTTTSKPSASGIAKPTGSTGYAPRPTGSAYPSGTGAKHTRTATPTGGVTATATPSIPVGASPNSAAGVASSWFASVSAAFTVMTLLSFAL